MLEEELAKLYIEYEQDVGKRFFPGTKTVPGDGEEKGYLFIGEAPGFWEQAKLQPFCGQSGQLLRATVEEVGFKPVGFTNVVKHHPLDELGDTRRPSPREVSASLGYIKREIEIYDPHTVVLVGKVAAGIMMEDFPRGQVYNGLKRRWIHVYHPAYIMRRMEYKHIWMDQLRVALRERS